MRYHCIVVLSVIATGLLASFAKSLSPPWDDMHIKHSWNAVPNDWVSLGRPPSGTTIDLYIALKPHRENALIDALYEVSEPGHPRYRAHLTKEQVADLVAPRPETLELVNSWLEHHGISSSSVSMTHGGDTLKLKGISVIQANTLLGASYQVYRHVERGETIVRTVGYSLPRGLHWHVLTVAPTTSFVSPRTQWQTPRNHSSGETVGLVKSASGEPAMMLSSRAEVNYVTPPFLRWLYDTATYAPIAMGENVLGVAGFLGDNPSPADLLTFMREYRDVDDATYEVVKINGGGYDPTHPHEEANSNIQYAEAMAYPTPHIFYSTGKGPYDWYVTWLEYVLDQKDIPRTISISYGYEERYVPREYAFYVCDVFAKLGVLGVSVLVSSGNGGIGKGTCMNKDGMVRFIPNFPGTCPYVTVVGGTTEYQPEVAAVLSGGGFSDHFKRPPYQRQAVPTFLEDLGSRYQGLYNASGRGTPDIAAQSINLAIFLNGQEKMASGTSIATPVVAGIISLLNGWLISVGQDPLGFLNPWLYGRGLAALNDITEGSNPGCGTDGFSAVAGWDPVTGLGTPNFRKMLGQLF
ncbi:subtilisin-like protein [Lactarius akahatsu]|uniref:tripeptidyl-peptidase II n=1 Tax=Lactarius akahatsu TaxID=416441 RepID=A0AAD4LEP8_9AGAM|nr:subtilisin-like protein [Lactarius akahatsu]